MQNANLVHSVILKANATLLLLTQGGGAGGAGGALAPPSFGDLFSKFWEFF